VKKHHQTLLHLESGESINVDTSLVHLIATLNDYGIRTKHCCQGETRGYVSIDVDNIECFIGVVNGEQKTMFNIRFPTPTKECDEIQEAKKTEQE
jgi:hypothetical protein